ncbi:MAG: hydantoinase B/oxoprolinase family protein [Burkholderiaceae bacterium]
MTNFDPVTLEILWARLGSIVDEAATGFVRTSFSSLVREANDYAVVLTDAQGQSLSQSSFSIPSFISTLPRTVRHMIDRFPPETLKPGDLLITNDPWLATGHIHDVSTVAPIFRRGRLIAFSAVTSHVPDIGGRVRSSDVPTIFEEGLQIPPLKLLDGGQRQPAVEAFIRTNVRVPDATMGDIWGQGAAHERIRARLLSLVDESELDLAALSHEICGRSERALRAAIAALPDGEYPYLVRHDGFESPLQVQCTVRVKGSDLEVDYTGTSRQVESKSINVVETYTYAYTAFAVKALLCPEVPNNEGSFRPLTVQAPPGSVLNAQHPVGTGARGQIGHILPVAVLGALGPVMGRRQRAEGSGNCVITMTGREQGRRFTVANFINAGQGASAERPGLSGISFPSNLGNSPIEILESEAPVLVRERSLRQGSGGAGAQRGGDGIRFAFDYVGEENATCSFLMTRRVVSPQGAQGGQAGEPASLRVNGEERDPVSVKLLQPGDHVVLETAGGGGFGRA